MPKRVLCIAFILIIVVACGVCISALAQGDGQFIEAQPQSEAAGNAKTTLFFVLSVGKDSFQAQDTARFLLQPILHAYKGTNTTLRFFTIKDGGGLSQTFDLSKPEDVEECIDALSGLRLYARISKKEQLAKAYQDFSDVLEKELEANDAKVTVWFVENRDPQYLYISKASVGATAEKLMALAQNHPMLEMHFAYLNDELYEAQPQLLEVAEAGALGQAEIEAETQANVESESDAFADGQAQAEGEAWQTNNEELRLDEYVRMSLAEQGAQSSGRVFTHLLPESYFSSEATTGENSIPALVRAEYRAALQVAEKNAPVTLEDNAIRLRVEHSPFNERGDALILVRLPQVAPEMQTKEASLPMIELAPASQAALDATAIPTSEEMLPTPAPHLVPDSQEAPKTLADANVEPASGALPESTPSAQGEASLLYAGVNRAWFLLRDCPAGSYDVTLSFARKVDDDAGWVSAIQLEYYQTVKESKLWLQAEVSGEDSGPRNRDDLSLTLLTDAIDVPIEKWQVRLLKNGQPLENAEVQNAQERDGSYQWKVTVPRSSLEMGSMDFSAEICLAAPDMLILESGNHITQELGNRIPLFYEDAVEKELFFDLPQRQNANEELKIDLAKLFHDPDEDELTYTVEGLEDGQAAETEHYDIRQEENLLYYLPKAGHGNRTEFSVTCQDYYGETSDACILVIQQYSVIELLKSMRATPAMIGHKDAEETVFQRQGEWMGKLQRELTFCFELKEEDGASPLALFAAAQKRFPQELPALEESLQISAQVGISQGQQWDISLTAEKGDDLWLIQGQLPAQSDNALYALVFSAAYLGVELPELMEPLRIRIENTAPYLRQSESVMQWHGDIQGPPFNREEVALSAILGLDEGQQIRLDEFFGDQETPLSLEYTFVVEEGAHFRIVQESNPLLPDEEGVYHPQINLQDGSCAIDIIFDDAGRFGIKASAWDGVNRSPAVSLRVNIESSFLRMLLGISLSTLAVVIVIVAVLAVKHHLMPSFQDAFVKVVCVESAQADVSAMLNRSRGMWLDYYGKRSVSLLTLLTTMEQPPLTSIPAACLADIYLSPVKKEKGIVRIACGKHAEQYQILLGKQVRLTAKEPVNLTANSAEVHATHSNGQEYIRIRFADKRDAFPSTML